jgi:hypothetical protein
MYSHGASEYYYYVLFYFQFLTSANAAEYTDTKYSMPLLKYSNYCRIEH